MHVAKHLDKCLCEHPLPTAYHLLACLISDSKVHFSVILYFTGCRYKWGLLRVPNPSTIMLVFLIVSEGLEIRTV